jgi:IS5 family transposase
MIRYRSQNQLTLAECDWPFQVALDEDNRWVKLSACIPWEEMAEGYYRSMSKDKGRPGKDARLVIGAVIIKHKLCLSDEETVAQLRENPYLQYFVGLSGYQMQAPFAPSLFVDIRKRMGDAAFEVFQQALIDAVEAHKSTRRSTASVHSEAPRRDEDDEPPAAAVGKLYILQCIA